MSEGRRDLDEVVRAFPYAREVRDSIRRGVDAVVAGFVQRWNGHELIQNIVLYWGDDSCELAYVNNSGLNGSLSDVKSHIAAHSFGEWLDGVQLAHSFVNGWELDMDALRKQFGRNKEDHPLRRILMLRICEALELSRAFPEPLCAAPTLRVLFAEHDDEDSVELDDRHVLAPPSAQVSAAEGVAELECSNCGTRNEVDRRKCAECAKPLREELRAYQKRRKAAGLG